MCVQDAVDAVVTTKLPLPVNAPRHSGGSVNCESLNHQWRWPVWEIRPAGFSLVATDVNGIILSLNALDVTETQT